jgi:hypothetical protein
MKSWFKINKVNLTVFCLLLFITDILDASSSNRLRDRLIVVRDEKKISCFSSTMFCKALTVEVSKEPAEETSPAFTNFQGQNY